MPTGIKVSGSRWIPIRKPNISIACGPRVTRLGEFGNGRADIAEFKYQFYFVKNQLLPNQIVMSISWRDIYRGKRVLITGHTGFKGAWLCEWLLQLGAQVHGYALDPAPHALLYDQLQLGNRIASDTRHDIRDFSAVMGVVTGIRPDFVFHLAAQPLVRLSYEIALDTFSINTMGTINVLEALRLAGGPLCVAVMVTTDKCYENREWLHAYREEDPMGGHDPYSASKGAAELAITSYRRSFFPSTGSVLVSSARAGNVIGGGDWAPDRIVPDAIRAIQSGQPILVRNPSATRPWQHVLEPLSGYLLLGAAIHSSAHSLPCAPSAPLDMLCSGFNFGPAVSSNQSVRDLIGSILALSGGSWEIALDSMAPHEASKLHLATEKAFHILGWAPVWNFSDTVRMTAAWYLQAAAGADLGELTRAQIDAFSLSSGFCPIE
jgi:CDP-glucose 4,6-dehydratase